MSDNLEILWWDFYWSVHVLLGPQNMLKGTPAVPMLCSSQKMAKTKACTDQAQKYQPSLSSSFVTIKPSLENKNTTSVWYSADQELQCRYSGPQIWVQKMLFWSYFISLPLITMASGDEPYFDGLFIEWGWLWWWFENIMFLWIWILGKPVRVTQKLKYLSL